MRKFLFIAPLLLLASGCLQTAPKKAAALGQIPACHNGSCGTVQWIKFNGKCYRDVVMYLAPDHTIMWDAKLVAPEECQSEHVVPNVPSAGTDE